MMIKQPTIIQIDKPTIEALKELRITEHKTQDEILRRLLKQCK